eukprot:IDg15690t1
MWRIKCTNSIVKEVILDRSRKVAETSLLVRWEFDGDIKENALAPRSVSTEEALLEDHNDSPTEPAGFSGDIAAVFEEKTSTHTSRTFLTVVLERHITSPLNHVLCLH